jgi:hypothetical protein
MTDVRVRDMFAEISAAPSVAPATSDELLDLAHARMRRRRLSQAAAGLASAAAVAVAVSLLPASPSPASQVTPGASDTTRPPDDDMYAGMTDALIAALPVGVTTRDRGAGEGGGVDGTWSEMFGVLVDVYVGDRGGQVLAYRIRAMKPPTGDLCARPRPPLLLVPDEPDTACQVVAVDGTGVRLATARNAAADGSAVGVRYAIRYYLDGWQIWVAETPYVNNPQDNPVPVLTAPVFTDAELARLAMNPAFLP